MARYGQTINSDLLGYYTAEQSVTKNQLAGVDYWTEDTQGAYFPRPATANNPFIFVKDMQLKDTDPETNGSDAFPTYRQFVFGVNLTF